MHVLVLSLTSPTEQPEFHEVVACRLGLKIERIEAAALQSSNPVAGKAFGCSRSGRSNTVQSGAAKSTEGSRESAAQRFRLILEDGAVGLVHQLASRQALGNMKMASFVRWL